MNVQKFEKNLEKKMKENSNKLIKAFSKGSNLFTLIEKPLIRDLGKILHIEFDILILITFMENINKNPKLKKKLQNEIGDVDKFFTSIKNCEMCIYTMYCEFERLNMSNKKNESK